MSAENTERQENFDAQVADFMERHPHYATPGARIHWFKIKVGYVALAIGSIIGIWAVSNHDSKNIKTQINKIGVQNCISGIQTVGKFNDLIDSIIETRTQSVARDKQMHDKQQLRIDQQAIRRYNADKIIPPTVPACRKVVLLK